MEEQPVQSSRPAWIDAFIPNKEVKVTPILISLNCLMWLIMVLSGVSPYGPSAEDASKWGATFAEGIGAGEYWRLIASNYIHYGFLHLGMNMLSLHQVGRLLERFIGPLRFGVLYTITGIAGSALSSWWSPYNVSAGASGAILGIVGVLVALLTTNLVAKEVRWPMLRSIGISIALVIFIGLSGQVDNAGHLGGFLAGAIGGYCIYPELKAYYRERKKNWYGLIAAFLIVSGAIGWLAVNTAGGKLRTVQQISTNFGDREAMAVEGYAKGKFTTPEQIDKNVIDVYRTGLLQMDSILEIGVTPESEVLTLNLKKYINQQIKSWEFTKQFHATAEQRFLDSAAAWSNRADTTMKYLNRAE